MGFLLLDDKLHHVDVNISYSSFHCFFLNPHSEYVRTVFVMK